MTSAARPTRSRRRTSSPSRFALSPPPTAVLLPAGLLLAACVVSATSAAPAQTSDLRLDITHPAQGDVVGRELAVTGTSAGISAQPILVFVYAPAADRWFFQGRATVGADGAWQVDPVIVSDGALRSARITAEGVRIVATAMDEVPSGLSGIPAADFPPPGTLAQSPVVVVSRGE